MTRDIKGKLYDIQGYSVHDGPGIRTTVFLKGCMLHCLWCHSPESISFDYELAWFETRCVGTEKCGLCLDVCPQGAISKAEPEKSATDGSLLTKIKIDRSKCRNCLICTQTCPAQALKPSGYEATVEEVFRKVAKDKIYFGQEGGVTISGGEPMAQFDFTLALAKRCKEEGISVCLDTTGYAPWENFQEILPYIDLFLYDLKHMDPDKCQKLVGVNNELILDNARRIAQNEGNLQIRVPVIPKLNATKENMEKTAAFCRELGNAVTLVQLLPYHSFGSAKYTRLGLPYKLNITPPSDQEMREYLELMQSMGLKAQIH
ncbi:MAG: glycyl-radical enzyme activating protein [Peptococcaceae bacterium]|nr:glycyl-radical enzyme activating protein [Peptococcaceae bacterium]NLM22007.1 glycyl-radical enzyme activating protein [Peptococcaceae bacterium]